MPEIPEPERKELEPGEIPFRTEGLSVSYSKTKAIEGISLDVKAGQITAIIGPSGCGKTTFLKTLNRMHEVGSDRITVGGNAYFYGVDIYGPRVSTEALRLHIGMVFQKPNPFPKSIYDNVAFGRRIRRQHDGLHGRSKADIDEVVEQSLHSAGLWNEVKDRLSKSAFSLSGGQQQRLCIARALATSPSALLLDEPCSSLDPIATNAIEDLLVELKTEVPMLLVTHNMQQASRIADTTAFFHVEPDETGINRGILVEHGPTSKIFTNPDDARTEGYITGRFG